MFAHNSFEYSLKKKEEFIGKFDFDFLNLPSLNAKRRGA